MNAHLRNLILICLTFATPLLYGHNETDFYNETGIDFNNHEILYNLSYGHWKQTMFNLWDAQHKTLEEKLNHIFEQIHKNPTNQKIIFYNYNLARDLFGKPIIEFVEQFEQQFDHEWWHALVDEFHIGCPCVYYACFSTTAQFAAIIKAIHKNPSDQNTIFHNYNHARAIFNKPEINALEQFEQQFDTQWWHKKIEEFNIKRQESIDKNSSQKSILVPMFLIEILGIIFFAGVLKLSSLLKPPQPLPALPIAYTPPDGSFVLVPQAALLAAPAATHLVY